MTRETITLRSLDIPRVAKFGVGFEQILDELLRTSSQTESGYPPYNIIRETENLYKLQLAVAGFEQGDITVMLENNTLVIQGTQTVSDLVGEYLHKGISGRDFRKTWPLADHVEVLGAEVRNGILTVTLERQIPEALKPKTIDIKYHR